MKVSWHILNKFVRVDEPVTPAYLSNSLTMSTVEVDDVIDQASLLDNIVVGLVEEVKPHPNADKLKLAVVNIGKEKVNIVCGGVNLRQHMRVALAKVGARVKWHGQGDWIKLERATIRGEVSEGMACAAEEIGVNDSEALEGGIMDLSKYEVKPGTPLASVLGFDDVILDIDNKSLTHRPDLWGHLGIARELAAVWQKKFLLPDPKKIESGENHELKVNIKVPKLAWRYLGLVVEGVKVKQSPVWMQQSLISLGLRPINNIVDVTNYVMAELGQPMHAFDLEKLHSAEIIVRLAKKGEKVKALDDNEYELNEADLVIADKKKVQAVAGVIGGFSSQVTNETKTIVLESACFESVNVRKTAARLNLRTDASARFEKGLDPNLAELAMRRAVELLREVAPGCKVASNLADEFPTPINPKAISFNLNWLESRLGFSIPPERVEKILTDLGFVVETKGNNMKVTPPTWRAVRDITLPEDIVEEVARIYGYDQVPLSLPKFTIEPPLTHPHFGMRKVWRQVLPSFGFTETLNYSFVSEADLNILDVKVADALELQNPLDQSLRWLRPNLVCGLLKHLSKNVKLFGEVKLFEIGRAFIKRDGRWVSGPKGESHLPDQPYQLVLGVSGNSLNTIESFRQLVGVVEGLFDKLNLEFSRVKSDKLPKYLSVNRGAELKIGDKLVGYIGEAAVVVQKQYDIPENTYLAIINLDDLPTDLVVKPVADLPAYPSITRDLSIVVPNYLTWAEIENVVKETAIGLESIKLFDVYETPALGEDKRSLAFHMVFRNNERTLKSEEVDKEIEKISKQLNNKFTLTIRS